MVRRAPSAVTGENADLKVLRQPNVMRVLSAQGSHLGDRRLIDKIDLSEESDTARTDASL